MEHETHDGEIGYGYGQEIHGSSIIAAWLFIAFVVIAVRIGIKLFY
jgi:hypothetical protein